MSSVCVRYLLKFLMNLSLRHDGWWHWPLCTSTTDPVFNFVNSGIQSSFSSQTNGLNFSNSNRYILLLDGLIYGVGSAKDRNWFWRRSRVKSLAVRVNIEVLKWSIVLFITLSFRNLVLFIPPVIPSRDFTRLLSIVNTSRQCPISPKWGTEYNSLSAMFTCLSISKPSK